ncbi:hypothetical protein H5410_060454 [Solanum commersonii]|uniref:Zinc knuckle family protein n=1 Tax=Solanum commersonii TaxID=4109 RepID=A0A9J5W634_SOLCO|nr:hypothetical protein H5410_060454 [Solanum commersonii]
MKSTQEGHERLKSVDNLGMALVPNREDALCLSLDHLEYFNGRFTNRLKPYLDSLRWISLDKDLTRRLLYQLGLLDTSNRKKIKHRDSRDSNHDKPYRKRRSKRELAKIKCYKGGNFGHIAPNCKLEKLKTLELEEKVHDKVYSFLYTSGSESDYASDSSSEEDIDLPDLCDNNQRPKVNACNACQGYICSCETDKFYKLQSQFEDLNINTITSTNVIELLKEVTNNNLREKIIQ